MVATIQATVFHSLAEEGFSQRTADDVPQTDEKDLACGGHAPIIARLCTCGRWLNRGAGLGRNGLEGEGDEAAGSQAAVNLNLPGIGFQGGWFGQGQTDPAQIR